MINGVINIYKTKGFTSHDVVAKLRGMLKQKKIGHTGTLDPDAIGVLPVCLGSATKLCDFLTDKEKEYIAGIRLGVVTDTQDMTGTILETGPVTVTEEQVETALQSFLGDYEQLPPMYSAVKVNGKKLYELARQGKEVERKARTVQIHGIEILSMELPFLTVKVACSKGTYIRTLCHDLGQLLGCGAAMDGLERTRSGDFRVDTAITLEALQKRIEETGTRPLSEALDGLVWATDSVFAHYPALRLKPEAEHLAENGNSFLSDNCSQQEAEKAEDGQQYRVYIREKEFVGIYEYRKNEKRFSPVKMFISK